MGAQGRALGMKSEVLAGEVVVELVYSCGAVVGLEKWKRGPMKIVECQGLGLGDGFQGH